MRKNVLMSVCYLKLVEGTCRPMMSAEYRLPLLAKTYHPAARSLCDGRSSYLLLLHVIRWLRYSTGIMGEYANVYGR